MKTTYRILVFVTLFGISTVSYASVEEQQLAGGYTTISASDPYVIAAANFAAQKIRKGSLNRIVKAESQVVAGVNYKIDLELKNTEGQLLFYQVIVFKPLPNSAQNMQLTIAKEIRSGSAN